MTFTIGRGETAPAFKKTVRDRSGQIVDLGAANEVEFHMRDSNYNIVVDDNTSGNVSIVDGGKGTVEYQWQSGDTSDVGLYAGEFVVTYSDGTTQSFPLYGNYVIEIEEDLS